MNCWWRRPAAGQAASTACWQAPPDRPGLLTLSTGIPLPEVAARLPPGMRYPPYCRHQRTRPARSSQHNGEFCISCHGEIRHRAMTQSRRSGPPGGWHQRSVMCLAAWLITNAGAGLCIRMRRGSSLISATWPRFATAVRGSPQDRCRPALVGCDRFWGHAGRHASRSTARHAWAGWARGGFLNSPVLLCTSAAGRPVG